MILQRFIYVEMSMFKLLKVFFLALTFLDKETFFNKINLK